MTIYLGADHRGFNLKEIVKQRLVTGGYKVVDMGNAEYDKDDDYPDYAKKVAHKVAEHEDDRGIVVCGSGFGVDIAANRIHGVRAALAMSPDHIAVGRHDDDVNLLAIPADFVSEAAAFGIVEKFLGTPFMKEERYLRRLKKL